MRRFLTARLLALACSPLALATPQLGAAQAAPGAAATPANATPVATSAQTLEAPGLSVFVEHNQFSPIFFDEKNAGLQMVLHGERIATDGQVRLNPTPEQWDPVPTFGKRTMDAASGTIAVTSSYPQAKLTYTMKVTPEPGGFRISVDLDAPLPAELVGKAGFNLDFLPTAYFGKTWLMGDTPGLFPRNAAGPMKADGSGDPEPIAARATSVTLSPEDPLTRVTITSDAPLALYDARNRAQNGWFVVRSLIAAGAQKDAVVWHVKPATIPGWTRAPVVSFNQAGYTPSRSKVAMIELDPAFAAPAEATLVKLTAQGEQDVLRSAVQPKGKFLRYNYAAFDFTSVREPGLYAIRYAGQTTNPFPIAADAYARIWQPSLDTFLPVQMDHVTVREQYRVWQRDSHRDDARQAPPNITHFDGYRMGANLDSPFKAGEHIPGLAVGGFQDAGDYDIQTPQNAQVVRDLVWARELFGLDWDQTSVDEGKRLVEIRKPDGAPDALQQIRHGALQLIAQYKVFGHSIVGIIDPEVRQYAHLGDAGSQTDGHVYDPALPAGTTVQDRSGTPDDRWAFTTDYPANDLAVAGGLAAASRALAGFDDALSVEALTIAKALWAKAQGETKNGSDGRDDGGYAPQYLTVAKAAATVEMILTTKGDPLYVARLKALLPGTAPAFERIGGVIVRALPYLDAATQKKVEAMVRASVPKLEAMGSGNPFGVPIAMGSWAGSGEVASFGTTMYLMHQAYPKLVGAEPTLRALDYMLGRHPANNLSLVSAVGGRSKLMGYGHNRADFGFIAGGMVPGVIVIKPDYPELKADWPFLWFENEYTVSTTASYILAARAAAAVAGEK
jgi:endoglucanase